MLCVLIRIASANGHPQYRFLGRNKQNYPLIIMKYHQISTLSLLLPRLCSNHCNGFTVVQKREQKSKQCRLNADSDHRSSLIWVYTVFFCLSVWKLLNTTNISGGLADPSSYLSLHEIGEAWIHKGAITAFLAVFIIAT